MSFRDMTVSELERLAALADAEAAFPMTEDAFRAFYDRTSRSVWGYLTRLTGDPSMADVPRVLRADIADALGVPAADDGRSQRRR
jgi:hypothetical protein